MKLKHTQFMAGLSILAMSFSFLAVPAVSSAQMDNLNPLNQDLKQKADGLFNLNQNFQNFWKPDFQRPVLHQRVCNRDDNNNQTAACNARVVTDGTGNAKSFVLPSGYGPQQLQAAYGSSGLAANKEIIGIVDAYDDPNIQSDLNAYSTKFVIPSLPACKVSAASSAVPCFQKVDQNGGTRYPQQNSGWALEISLDVEAAHSLCENCSIILVEAASNSFTNLLTGVDRAATLGSTAISNSWGGNEFSGETAYDSHLNKPGIAITFSSGDGGYGTEYPASSQYVTAVGGTSLSMNNLNYSGETAWSGAGSGCSQYENKPAWQTDAGCKKRTVADVSAVADPNTGAAVYDSVRYQGRSGWFQVGGTSLASPIVAAIYALSGNTSGIASQLPYQHPSMLHDVTAGSNGSCGGSYLCTAKQGFDGPTGLGSPNGLGAF